MYYAITKYDNEKNPIMTSLFNRYGFLYAIAGWYNTDDMVKMYFKKS